jgi:hypothetical protein
MPTRKHEKPAEALDYEVGYGKPPVHSRFQPGQSGNPAGRRKGVRNLKTDVGRMLSAPIRIKEGGRTRTKSTQEGALMLLREKTLRGDARASDRFFDLAIRYNSDPADQHPDHPLSVNDRSILAAYLTETIAAVTEQRASTKSSDALPSQSDAGISEETPDE